MPMTMQDTGVCQSGEGEIIPLLKDARIFYLKPHGAKFLNFVMENIPPDGKIIIPLGLIIIGLSVIWLQVEKSRTYHYRYRF